MGLRDRVHDVRRTSAAALPTDAVRAAGRRLTAGREAEAETGRTGPGGRLSGAARGIAGAGKSAAVVAQDADDWIRDQLAAVTPPGRPLTEPWKLSIGALVARHPKAPNMIGKLLGPLDRFGAIVIGPEEIGFDGDEVEWTRVTAIRTRTVAELACGAIWDFVVDDLRTRLPPVPGRKWAVTKVLQILMAMAVGLEDEVEGEGNADEPRRVACEIVYRGRLRRDRTAAAGLFSGLALCTMPEIGEALAGGALDRGVPMIEAEPREDLSPNQRVARLRARRAGLAEQARESSAGD